MPENNPEQERQTEIIGLYDEKSTQPFVIIPSVPSGDKGSPLSNISQLEENFRTQNGLDQKPFFFVNNYGNTHWDSTQKDSNGNETKIESSGQGNACGAYTFLNIVKASKFSEKIPDLKNIEVNELKPSSARVIMAQAIEKNLEGLLKSSDQSRDSISRSLTRIRTPNEMLETDDLKLGLQAVGIKVVEATELDSTEITKNKKGGDLELQKRGLSADDTDFQRQVAQMLNFARNEDLARNKDSANSAGGDKEEDFFYKSFVNFLEKIWGKEFTENVKQEENRIANPQQDRYSKEEILETYRGIVERETKRVEDLLKTRWQLPSWVEPSLPLDSPSLGYNKPQGEGTEKKSLDSSPLVNFPKQASVSSVYGSIPSSSQSQGSTTNSPVTGEPITQAVKAPHQEDSLAINPTNPAAEDPSSKKQFAPSFRDFIEEANKFFEQDTKAQNPQDRNQLLDKFQGLIETFNQAKQQPSKEQEPESGKWADLISNEREAQGLNHESKQQRPKSAPAVLGQRSEGSKTAEETRPSTAPEGWAARVARQKQQQGDPFQGNSRY